MKTILSCVVFLLAACDFSSDALTGKAPYYPAQNTSYVDSNSTCGVTAELARNFIPSQNGDSGIGVQIIKDIVVSDDHQSLVVNVALSKAGKPPVLKIGYWERSATSWNGLGYGGIIFTCKLMNASGEGTQQICVPAARYGTGSSTLSTSFEITQAQSLSMTEADLYVPAFVSIDYLAQNEGEYVFGGTIDPTYVQTYSPQDGSTGVCNPINSIRYTVGNQDLPPIFFKDVQK